MIRRSVSEAIGEAAPIPPIGKPDAAIIASEPVRFMPAIGPGSGDPAALLRCTGSAQSKDSQAPELGKKHSPHFQSASNEELRKGGAWRDVFSKTIGGRKSYEKIRRQIFGRDASQTDH